MYSVAVGCHHSVVLDEFSNVHVFGANNCFQGGVIESQDNIIHEGSFIKVFATAFSTFILDNDGLIWCCGYNSLDKLGVKNIHFVMELTKITIPHKVIHVACSPLHTMLLDEMQQVWTCGGNTNLQLGISSDTLKILSEFTMITNLPPINNIAVTHDMSMLVDDTGNVWYSGNSNLISKWLNNDYCNGTFTELQSIVNISQVAFSTYEMLFLDFDGKVSIVELDNEENVSFFSLNEIKPDIPQIQQVCVGCQFSLLLDCNDEVWGKGKKNSFCNTESDSQQYVKINSLPKIKFISTYHQHILFVSNQGDIWGVGNNMYKQLGSKSTGNIPCKIDNWPKVTLNWNFGKTKRIDKNTFDL